jgi:D-inositol-3-phosphate glycosyltransferase
MMISDHADPLAKIGSKEAGGQNIYVYYLASFLADLGVQVDVFTRWDHRNKRQTVQVKPNFRVIRVKAGPKAFIHRDKFSDVQEEFTRNIGKHMVAEGLRYDLIHTNYWYSGVTGLELARVMNLPMVHVFHSIGEIRYRVLKRFQILKKEQAYFQRRIESEKKIARESTAIIATSPVEKKLIIKLFKVPPQKVFMIPIGIDSKIFYPIKTESARKKLKIPMAPKIILYVGRIEWRKGLGTLLFAFKEVLKKFPDSFIYIAGGGKTKLAKKLEEVERKREQGIINQLQLQERVIYLGPINQNKLYLYYNSADVCAVPSYYEPFGIVPLEAMACGTPVVASRTGGLQFTTKHNATGYLFKPRNYPELADKLGLTLSRGKDYYREKSLRRVKKEFLWPRITKTYQEYFNKLIKS